MQDLDTSVSHGNIHLAPDEEGSLYSEPDLLPSWFEPWPSYQLPDGIGSLQLNYEVANSDVASSTTILAAPGSFYSPTLSVGQDSFAGRTLEVPQSSFWSDRSGMPEGGSVSRDPSEHNMVEGVLDTGIGSRSYHGHLAQAAPGFEGSSPPRWTPMSGHAERFNILAAANSTRPPPPGGRRQSPRHSADLYTARWIRGEGVQREGWCNLCRRWLRLKNSEYWYDKTFSHGVSHATGLPFDEPCQQRTAQHCPAGKNAGRRTRAVEEGQCNICRKWYPLASGRSGRKRGQAWYKHAYKASRTCQRHLLEHLLSSISSRCPSQC